MSENRVEVEIRASSKEQQEQVMELLRCVDERVENARGMAACAALDLAIAEDAWKRRKYRQDGVIDEDDFGVKAWLFGAGSDNWWDCFLRLLCKVPGIRLDSASTWNGADTETFFTFDGDRAYELLNEGRSMVGEKEDLLDVTKRLAKAGKLRPAKPRQFP